DAAPARIFASDIDTRSLDACRVNAEQVGLSGKITVEQKDFFLSRRGDYPDGKVLLVMNPPYGERLSHGANILDFYHAVGEKVSGEYPLAGFAVIVPGEAAERALKLRWDRKIPFMNGGLKVALLIRDIK
ncbi:MAG: hypothetical protein ACRCUT_03725, partial [Spirochaetota bacterium]